MQAWKQWAKQLKRDVYALYFAAQDARLPWYIKLLAILVVAYAFSPLDLIPDFIPVLGYLDDLVIVPWGIWLTLKLMPQSVLAEARQRASVAIAQGQGKPKNWVVGGIIISIWFVTAVLLVVWLQQFLQR
jgi:uncharacterized membrane protein YkvA (DUF1232 family)